MDFEEMKNLPPEKQKELFNRLKTLRGPYKAANYSCIYGVGAPKLARELGISKAEAAKLIEAYWERNWAVKEVIKEQTVKHLNGEMWLWNPVSQFWISLRYEKDLFSSLNQSTGVFVFDTWKAFVKNLGEKVCLEYHDEILLITNDIDKTEKNLMEAIGKANQRLNLNVRVDIDSKYGENYAEVH